MQTTPPETLHDSPQAQEGNVVQKYIEVECVLKSPSGECGFKVRLHANDKGVSGMKLVNHLRDSHRVHLANIQPILLTNIYSKSPFFVVRDTNDEEMLKWVKKK